MARYTCPKCGGNYPGFHICMDMDKATAQEVVLSPEQKAKSEKNRYTPRRTYSSSSTREKTPRVGKRAKQREAEKDRDAAIVEAYKSKPMSLKMVAEEFGISVSIARRVLLEAQERGEVQMNQPGVRLYQDRAFSLQDTEKRKEIVKLYVEDGMKQKDIAEKFGVHYASIARVLREENAKIRRGNKAILKPLREHYGELYTSVVDRYNEKNAGMGTIAKEQGVSFGLVSKILNDAEVQGLTTIRDAGSWRENYTIPDPQQGKTLEEYWGHIYDGIVDAYNTKGLTAQTIGRAFRVLPSEVSLILEDAKLSNRLERPFSSTD